MLKGVAIIDELEGKPFKHEKVGYVKTRNGWANGWFAALDGLKPANSRVARFAYKIARDTMRAGVEKALRDGLVIRGGQVSKPAPTPYIWGRGTEVLLQSRLDGKLPCKKCGKVCQTGEWHLSCWKMYKREEKYGVRASLEAWSDPREGHDEARRTELDGMGRKALDAPATRKTESGAAKAAHAQAVGEVQEGEGA